MKRVFLILLIFSSCSSEDDDLYPQIEEINEQIRSLVNSDIDQALLLADQSIELAETSEDLNKIAHAYFVKGFLFSQKKETSKAFLSYTKAASVLEGEEDEKSLKTYTKLLVNTGATLRTAYKYDEAIALYDKGIKLATQYQFTKQRQLLLYNKSHALWKKGRLPDAVETLTQSVQLASQANDSTRMIRCFNLLGLINKDSELFEEAKAYFNYILASPSASKEAKAKANHNMGNTYLEEGNYEKAIHFFNLALAQKKTLNKPSLMFTSLFCLSESYYKQHKLEEAIEYGIQAGALYPDLSHDPDTYDIYRLLVDIYEEKKAFEQAKNYADRAIQEPQHLIDYQNDILIKLRQHEMDLILTGIEKEKEAEQKQAAYRRSVLALLVIIGTGLLLFTLFHIRRKIKRKEITLILNEFEHNTKSIFEYKIK